MSTHTGPGGLVDHDAQLEQAVFDLVLRRHPLQLTLDELVRELAGDQPEFAEQDAVRNAVGDLIGSGLLHRNDRFLSPTNAAFKAHNLPTR
jgi:hypothetical protein